ncbi:PREDICTED: uncharacterized protein LOC109241271 [Nicotiana attenuata]|uniref:uncharacterized protein LOC109241271 n=1 Tax=Nicotiana attenuata TaxID=49451 RepID=UPI00090542B2|nr:PREDICTED: uncharacterized protein LOC109241271 [Nicotiana attenuata]
MDLSFIAPTIKNGEVIIKLCKEEVEEETQKWKQALILYVVGSTPTIGAMERFIASAWNFTTKPKVYFHNDGYFVVRFNSISDRDEILYSGPHMLNNNPIIMRVWSTDFDFNKEVLQIISVWVRYPNLPLNCWGVKSLSRISSGLGIPFYADACTTQLDRISYARVLIEMDVTKDLPKAIKVTDPNGREFLQEVAYDWVPEFCHTCIQMGHQSTEEETRMAAQSDPERQGTQPNVVANNSKEVAVLNGAKDNCVKSPMKLARGEQEYAWKKAIGKSVTRSREKPST